MRSPSDDLVARRPVWEALASMFLDTDVTLTRDWRASVLAASPYAVSEIEQILIEEIYPMCWANLLSVAGEWSGFDAAWLEARILRRQASSESLLRLLNLGRIAVPRSHEWIATRSAVESLRGAGPARG